MNNNSLIPFAFSIEKNRMVCVDEVQRGLECSCVCPKCRMPLIAKQGDVKEHHFAHKSEADCVGAFETSIHKMAKQIIKDKGFFFIPMQNKTGKIEFRQIIFNSVILEEQQKFGDVEIIPDVIGLCGHSVVYIEIFVTHKLDEDKINLIKGHNITLMEVDLSSFLENSSVGREMLENEIYNPCNVRFHHVEQPIVITKMQPMLLSSNRIPISKSGLYWKKKKNKRF